MPEFREGGNEEEKNILDPESDLYINAFKEGENSAKSEEDLLLIRLFPLIQSGKIKDIQKILEQESDGERNISNFDSYVKETVIYLMGESYSKQVIEEMSGMFGDGDDHEAAEMDLKRAQLDAIRLRGKLGFGKEIKNEELIEFLYLIRDEIKKFIESSPIEVAESEILDKQSVDWKLSVFEDQDEVLDAFIEAVTLKKYDLILDHKDDIEWLKKFYNLAVVMHSILRKEKIPFNIAQMIGTNTFEIDDLRENTKILRTYLIELQTDSLAEKIDSNFYFEEIQTLAKIFKGGDISNWRETLEKIDENILKNYYDFLSIFSNNFINFIEVENDKVKRIMNEFFGSVDELSINKQINKIYSFFNIIKSILKIEDEEL